MAESNVIFVCLSAFIAVFVLLSFIAAIIRVILAVFPEKTSSADAALLAAVSTTYQSIYPGTQITKLEEEK